MFIAYVTDHDLDIRFPAATGKTQAEAVANAADYLVKRCPLQLGHTITAERAESRRLYSTIQRLTDDAQ